jgi:hypothetical protein
MLGSAWTMILLLVETESCELFAQGWSQTILLIFNFQVARITGVRHHTRHLAKLLLNLSKFENYVFLRFHLNHILWHYSKA